MDSERRDRIHEIYNAFVEATSNTYLMKWSMTKLNYDSAVVGT